MEKVVVKSADGDWLRSLVVDSIEYIRIVALVLGKEFELGEELYTAKHKKYFCVF